MIKAEITASTRTFQDSKRPDAPRTLPPQGQAGTASRDLPLPAPYFGGDCVPSLNCKPRNRVMTTCLSPLADRCRGRRRLAGFVFSPKDEL